MFTSFYADGENEDQNCVEYFDNDDTTILHPMVIY